MGEFVSKKGGISLEPDGRDVFLFKRLLEISREKLKAGNRSMADWRSFEKDVDGALRSAIYDHSEFSDWKIEYVGGHKFPDIVARILEKRALGVEVKTISSKESGWSVMGGSIMESTRVPDVSRIYVFCARKNPFEIKFRPFEDCVKSVAVTHSPRYMLDMDLSAEESLFQKLKIPYDEIRLLPNPFEPFKKEWAKLHPEADVCWWRDAINPSIGDEVEREEEHFAGVLLNTNLRFWADLGASEKRDKRARMMILFPEVFQGRSQNQYRGAAVWLYNHHIINPSMRDVFSAGGRRGVSAVVERLKQQKDDVVKLFRFECVALFGDYQIERHYEKWRIALQGIYENKEEQCVLDGIVEEIGERIRSKGEDDDGDGHRADASRRRENFLSHSRIAQDAG